MAKIADAIVYLATDVSKLTSGFASAESKTDSFVGRATKLLGGALAGGALAAGAAIVGIGTAAFNVAQDTDTAAKDMAASLGIPIEEAEKFAAVAQRVYGNNFADSVGDASEAVQELARTMDLAADDANLQGLAEDAFRLRDAFGIDVTESIDAAKTLMDQFGLTGQQAFDLIAKGNQEGLNRSGDFLDTIGEYSNLFSAAGFDAGQFYSILETGSQGGVLGTDKIADAMKEMGIILNEGGDDAKAAFDAIGLNYDRIAGYVRAGDEAWADYFPGIIAGLNSIENPIARSQAQVALFGTMAEDLGVSFTEGLSSATTSLDAFAGSADLIDQKYQTLGQVWEGAMRQISVGLAPLGEALLPIAQDLMPLLVSGISNVVNALVPFIDGLVAVSQYLSAVIEDGDTMNDWLTHLPGPIQGMVKAIGDFINWIRDLISGLRDGEAGAQGFADKYAFVGERLSGIMTALQALVGNVLGAIQAFWEANGETITRIVGTMFQIVETTFRTALDFILGMVEFWIQLLSGDFAGAAETLVGIFTNLWAGIREIFRLELEYLYTLITGFDWAAAGRAIVGGIRDGISSRWGELEDWFRGRLEGLRNMLPFSEPRDPDSPLRGLKDSGQALVAMLQAGIDDVRLTVPIPSLANMQPVGAMAGGGVNITINVSGNGDTGQAARGGVLSALRQAGLA